MNNKFLHRVTELLGLAGSSEDNPVQISAKAGSPGASDTEGA